MMLRQTTDETRIAAVLHIVVEDGDCRTPERPRAEGFAEADLFESVLAELGRVLAAWFRIPAARARSAGCFVTGDKALLELGEVAGPDILSPRQFWERYRPGR